MSKQVKGEVLLALVMMVVALIVASSWKNPTDGTHNPAPHYAPAAEKGQ